MSEGGPAKPKPVRVNVKARAQLFERATNEDSAAERRRKHAEVAFKAKTVQQVLKQVETGDGTSRRGSDSELCKPKRAQIARETKTVQQVLKTVVSSDESDGKSKEVKDLEKKIDETKIEDEKSKEIKVDEKIVTETKVEEEKTKEKLADLKSNGKKDGASGTDEKKKTKLNEGKILKTEGKRKKSKSDEKEKNSPEKSATVEKDGAIIRSQQAPTCESKKQNDSSVEKDSINSLTELEIDTLLREECNNAPEKQTNEVNSLTVSKPHQTETSNNTKKSTFWKALSDSGSSSSSSVSEPECASNSHLNPARTRSRSEPSSLLSQLGLGVSRSSTSSPELTPTVKNDSIWLNGSIQLEIGEQEKKNGGKKLTEQLEYWQKKKAGHSKFARGSTEGDDDVANSNFSNLTSSGVDKWRLLLGNENDDYELRVKDEKNPLLLELLNSVQKIQKEFGDVIVDETNNSNNNNKKKNRPPFTKSVSFPDVIEKDEQTKYCSDFDVNKDGGRRKSCVGLKPEDDDDVFDEKTSVLTTSDEMERRSKQLASSSSSSSSLKPVQNASSRKYEPPFFSTFSKPHSPPSKIQVTPKPDLPPYLTVARKGYGARKYEQNTYSDSERVDFDKIETILNDLDFSKYRRGRSNTLSPRTPRSFSESPRPLTRIPVQPVVNKCVQQQPTRLQVPPHTYRHYSSPTCSVQSPTPCRHKLRELTEKLKPVSGSSSPLSNRLPSTNKQQEQLLLQQQWHNQQLQQQLLQQHKQLQQLQQQHLEQLQRLQQQTAATSPLFDTPGSKNNKAELESNQNKGEYYVSGSLTLPHRMMESDKNNMPKIEIVPEESPTTPRDSVHDEGLGAESSLPSTYVQTYHNVTRRCDQGPISNSPPDKRGKRRKNGNNVGFQLSYENKNGNGRSLTYPPQRKGSLSDEIEFTSVDSNGMMSFGGAINVDQEPRRQLSDVSLADSHYSPSESNVGETYLDVMERVTQQANEMDERGVVGKGLKKKHYSDPSADKNDALLDLPEFIAAAKSEPHLGNNKNINRKFRMDQETDEQFVVPEVCYDDDEKKVGILRSSQSAPVPLVSSDAENSDKERFPGKSPHQQRRYFKKRLRGPYGEMLEEEMRKSGEKQMKSQLTMAQELSFLQDIIDSKQSANLSSVDASEESWPEVDNGKSGEGDRQDTRTHVVGELYDTERSYVESLQILVNKYYQPLKSSDNSNLVDSGLVDDMFFQIPEILCHHESFLDLLRHRLENWDNKQKVGDVFVEAFTKQQVINTYTAFINNWKTAKEAIKIATHAKPAFAKFLEHTSREHKGKLTLDALLIMPVQRIPRYELLIKELLKHTQVDHPDHRLLVMAQKEVHELAVKINRMEKEAYAAEQMLQKLKEIENVIDGLVDLVQPDRSFLRYDLVTMSGGLGTKKERCLFLFSDLLIITSIKRKSGTAIRKASAALNSPAATSCPLEMNKYKMLMKLSLEDLDTSKNNDVNVKKTLKEIDQLEEDCSLLGQISDLTNTLNCVHQSLDEIVRDMLMGVSKQLQEKHSADSHFLSLELTVTTQEGIENLTLVFSSPDKRATWETAFTEAKQKLSLTNGHRPPPEFISPVPIRKTRAGLQFTCATPTLGLNGHNLRDVWVCNSDGYVGQVCVLSLQPDPTVTSCNGVTNARILCIVSVPAASASSDSHQRTSIDEGKSNCQNTKENTSVEKNNSNNIQLDSESSEEEDEGIETQDDDALKKKEECLSLEESHEVDDQQPTMWLGTEDGCVHIYNCNDNIRTKKNKVKLQHPASIHSILHTDNKVFVSLANGDLTIYTRDTSGGWRTNDPKTITVGSAVAPISRMISVAGKLWCACQNTIKVINTSNLQVEQTFAVTSDTNRSINCMATSGFGVWISIQNSATIKLFHATSFECLLDLSVAASVTKMLAGCDDIIRQHKSACLRITALLSCKDLMWVGTSAGVILTIILPHLTSNSTKLNTLPTIAGIPHGHSGHVRFLTYVEMQPNSDNLVRSRYSHRSLKGRDGLAFSRRSSLSATMANKMLVISGGDGYEDFRNTDLGEAAGRDDSTNHLLLWQV